MRRSARFAFLLASGLAACSVHADVTLRLVVWDGDDGLKVIRQAVTEFESANPGIRVKLENVPYGQYATKLLAQVAANASPDVAMMEPKMFQAFAKRGASIPLEPYFGQTSDFQIGDYYKPIVDAHRFRGQLYALPRDIAPIGLIYYNKRLFREAGIPFPDGTWTWDWEPRPHLREKDFTWVMQQLSKVDKSGRPVQWGFVPAWNRAFADTLVYSQGLRYTNDPEHPTQWTWTDPGVVKAYQWLADIGRTKHWVPSSTEISNVLMSSSDKLFLEQKAAMFQCGIWAVPGFRKALKPGSREFFDWDITLAPGHIDEAGKVVRAAPTGGSGYSIMKICEHPREAWLLLKWMAGPPAMRLMAQAGLAQPAIRKLALEEPWIPGPSTPEDQRYPASRHFTDDAVPYVVFDPTADYYPELNSFMESKIDGIMAGTSTAKDAFATGESEVKPRLDQILKQESLPPFRWDIAMAGGFLACLGILVWLYGPKGSTSLTSAERKESRAAYGFLTPWIIGTVALTLGPMILSLLMSLADWDIMSPAKWKGVTNYTDAFTQDARFWAALKVTGVYTLFAVPLGILVSLAMALLLNTRVRGVPLFRTLFYLPALSSTVAASLIFKKLFQAEGGLVNAVIYGTDGKGDLFGLATAIRMLTGSVEPANWLGDERLALWSLIVMSLWGAGGGMVILLAGLQAIPQFYYEAAVLDGAGAWQRFKAVTFPLLTPSLFFTLITGVIASFQTFTQAFVMTSGGPGDSTRFYVLHLYNQAFQNLRMGYASALAWILFALILLFTIVQWRLNRYVHYEGGTS